MEGRSMNWYVLYCITERDGSVEYLAHSVWAYNSLAARDAAQRYRLQLAKERIGAAVTIYSVDDQRFPCEYCRRALGVVHPAVVMETEGPILVHPNCLIQEAR
jgi:hypothetical protein